MCGQLSPREESIWRKIESLMKKIVAFQNDLCYIGTRIKQLGLTKLFTEKGEEGDSWIQRPTGIQRHRLRALFGRGYSGNTLELTG